jgi:RimJ/RimL family protein N-acetyltransferase
MSIIYGERIRLRAPSREDIPLFLEWFNDPEVTLTLFVSLPISKDEEEKWFDDMLKSPLEQHPLTIEVKQEGGWKPIGNISFMDIDWISRSAEVGIVIGEKDYWNKGYGSEAMQLMLKHGFETLNLHRIWLRVYGFNTRAIRAYEKSGFVHEGRKREASFIQGKYHDVLVMSVLQPEWKGG